LQVARALFPALCNRASAVLSDARSLLRNRDGTGRAESLWQTTAAPATDRAYGSGCSADSVTSA
ncbi:MAG: hypothetical protein WAK85_14055, partial [Xanthobacteraceae bacterium]